MTDKYKEMLDALMAEGFHQISDNKKPGYDFDFKITPYSLNTKLSFRFDNFDHFTEFLKNANAHSPEREEVLQATFLELGLKEGEFFWVNFYASGQETEM